MSEFEIRIPGTKVTINTEDSIEDIKKKLPQDKIEIIFNNVDTNESGTIDTDAELDTFKKNLNEAGYIVNDEAAKDNKKINDYSATRAYNSTIQNLRSRYGDIETLKSNFEQAEDKLHTLKKGDTLWKIAKNALVEEGLEPTPRAINDRISQIAAINGLNDVNNVYIGTAENPKKLIVRLTETGIQKVKAAENQNSASALGGISTPTVQKVKKQDETPKTDKTKDNKSTKKQDNKPVETKVEYSDIKLSKNINIADEEGWVPAEDQTDVKTDEFTNFGSDNDVTETVVKYEKTEGEGENAVTKTIYQYTAVQNGVTFFLQADTLDGLKEKYNNIAAKQAEIKGAPENESEEDAKTRKAVNLTAIKEYLAEADNNIEYVKEAITALLKNDTLVDKNSDEFKAFVDDLIRTKDAEVIKEIIMKPDKDNNGNDCHVYDNSLLVNDKKSSEDIAGIYQEIRAKEKAGEKLDKNELEIKATLKNYNLDMYTISADTEKGIHAKTMSYKRDGQIFYKGTVDGFEIEAKTEEMFEEFAGKLEEILKETDEGKKNEALQALFKEYSTTKDDMLARTLAWNAKELNASQEDLFNLIDNNDINVLAYVKVPANYTDEANKALVDKVLGKYNVEFSNKNIKNANHIKNVFKWIDLRGNVQGKDNEENDKTFNVQEIKDAIITNSFFTKEDVPVVDNEGKPVDADGDGKQDVESKFTFTPRRRPTAEEMEALLDQITSDTLKKAIIEYMDIEDDTEGQYTQVIEDKLFDSNRADIKSRYEKHIDSLETLEELSEFINAKISLYNTNDRIAAFPFDKVMEKLESFNNTYGTEYFLAQLIASVTEGNGESNRNILSGSISDENRLKIVQSAIYTDEETGEKSISSILGASSLAKVLPRNCKEGEAKEAYKTILMNLFKGGNDDDDARALVYMMNHCNVEFDNEMANKVVNYIENNFDSSKPEVIINDRFKTQVWAKLPQDKQKELADRMIKWDTTTPNHDSSWYGNDGTGYQSVAHYFAKELGCELPDGCYIVEKGDTISKFMIDYLKKNKGLTEAQAKNYVARCGSYLKQSGLDKIHAQTVVDIKGLPWDRFNGYRYGEALFKEAKGFKLSDDVKEILKGEGDYAGWINKDTVVGIIEQFNSHKDEENIMKFLDNEAGPSKDEMNVIPKALLEKAKEIGLEEDEAYKELDSFVAEQSGSFWDYGPKDAEKMDNLIKVLIKKMYETNKIGYPKEEQA